MFQPLPVLFSKKGQKKSTRGRKNPFPFFSSCLNFFLFFFPLYENLVLALFWPFFGLWGGFYFHSTWELPLKWFFLLFSITALASLVRKDNPKGVKTPSKTFVPEEKKNPRRHPFPMEERDICSAVEMLCSILQFFMRNITFKAQTPSNLHKKSKSVNI